MFLQRLPQYYGSMKEEVKIDFTSKQQQLAVEEAAAARKGLFTIIFEFVKQKFDQAFIENLPTDELKELPPKCKLY